MLAIRPDRSSPKHSDILPHRSDAYSTYAFPDYRQAESRSHSSCASTIATFPCKATLAHPVALQASRPSANRRSALKRLLNSSCDLRVPPLRSQTSSASLKPSMSAVPSSKSSDDEPNKPVPEQKDSCASLAGAVAPVPPQTFEQSSLVRLPPLQSLINTLNSGTGAPLATVEPRAGSHPAFPISSTQISPTTQVLSRTVPHAEPSRFRAAQPDPVFSRPQTAVTSPSSSYVHTPQRHGGTDLMPSPMSASSHPYGYARDRSISNTSTMQSYGQGSVRNTLGKRKLSDVQESSAASGSAVATIPKLERRPTTGAPFRIRQQPRACRACGFGERDRRVIDPPPILSFDTDDDDSLQYVTIAHASLLDEQGERDVTHAQPSNRKLGGTLMGNMVASCISGRDEYGRPGKFFVFTDLSCRAYGNYRLRFSLVRLPIGPAQPGTVAPAVDHVISDVFTVFSAKEFPGMRPSSGLARALKEQGHDIPLKKGKRSGLAMPEAGEADSDDDDDYHEVKRRRR